jgi:hypothetical protein
MREATLRRLEMTVSNWLIVGFIGSVVLAAGLAYGAENQKEAIGAISLVRSSKQQDREQGQRLILEERARVVKALIETIKLPRDKNTERWLDESTSRNIAIACIGEYRAPEAVPSLLPLLEPAPGEVVVAGRILRLSPAGRALVKIGKPSVSAVIELLATTDAKKMSASQARLVLYDIEGAVAGEKTLQDAVTAEKDAARRAALEASVKAFHDQYAGY